jgi:DNA-binding NtrC family response regulator
MKDELEALVEKMIAGGIYFEEAVKEFEKQFIYQTVAQHANNLSKASVALGIHRNTLTKRIQEYESIENPKPAVAPAKKRQVAPRRKSRLQAVAR